MKRIALAVALSCAAFSSAVRLIRHANPNVLLGFVWVKREG
jgi:hypothetical protein